jgi:transcriptional regulator with XRE-family HTH domain
MEINLKIKELIDQKGITLKLFGEKLGRSRQNVYDIINGKQQITVELLEKIAIVLDVPINTFFETNHGSNRESEILLDYFKLNEKNFFLFLWVFSDILFKVVQNSRELREIINENLQNFDENEKNQVITLLEKWDNLGMIKENIGGVFDKLFVICGKSVRYESLIDNIKAEFFQRVDNNELFRLLLQKGIVDQPKINHEGFEFLNSVSFMKIKTKMSNMNEAIKYFTENPIKTNFSESKE